MKFVDDDDDMGSHSVTCQPAEVTFPHLTQPNLVLDLATPDWRDARLSWPRQLVRNG